VRIVEFTAPERTGDNDATARPHAPPHPLQRNGKTPAVITRVWRGWTATENADAYEQFLLNELFPSMRSIPGFRGADVLRRLDGNEVAFVTLTRFDSLDDIRKFAGEDFEVPVLEPQALALLSRYDERALHFDTASFTT
jgi:hypothetical protein